MLTHRHVAANIAQQQAVMAVREGDVVLAVAPFFHALGMNVVLAGSLSVGATIVTLARFDVEPFLAAIQDCGSAARRS
jgi:acyl-CoA synthetase (AMP-forming)/AMP-acid ligase II